MPITLKLSRPRASVARGETEGSTPQSSSPSPAPVRAPPSGSIPASAGAAGPSTSTPAPRQRRRTRSPTPPSTAHSLCLPLPPSSSSSAALSRSSSSSGHSTPDTPRPALSPQEVARALSTAIQRYALLAGYSSIEPRALRVLRAWLEKYVEALVLRAGEAAEASGRAVPGARDLWEGMVYQGQVSPVVGEGYADAGDNVGAGGGVVERKGEGETGKERSERTVKELIDWRHRVPDFHEPYTHRLPQEDTTQTKPDAPKWARRDDPALALLTRPDRKGKRRRVDGGDGAGEDSGGESEDEGGDSDGYASDNELISNKTRHREKALRAEIPAHLPDLPALHTWKHTDSFPVNKLLSHAQQARQARRSPADAEDEEQEGDKAAAGTGASSATLSRLESRLVSARLVQTSLRSLIGRLDGAARGQGVGTGSASPATAASAAANANAGPGEDTHTPLPQPPQSAPAAPAPTRGRLSIRLRHQSQSSSQSQGQSQSQPQSAITHPQQPAPHHPHAQTFDPSLASPSGSGFPFGAQGHTRRNTFSTTSSSALAGSGPASAGPTTPWAWTLLQNSSAGATPSSAGAGGAGGYPWSNPLLSPATPAPSSAGMAFPLPFGLPPTPTSALPGTPASAGFGPAEGYGGAVAAQGQGTGGMGVPPVVNFKSGWYARRGGGGKGAGGRTRGGAGKGTGAGAEGGNGEGTGGGQGVGVGA